MTAPVGEYQLQAAIAALHDEADRPEDTDWPQILALYGLLEHLTGNPVVSLNRAIAAAMVHGPTAGWSCSRRWTSGWPGTTASTPSRAPLRDGRRRRAAANHYRAAARRTTSLPERHYLTTKAAAVTGTARKPQ